MKLTIAVALMVAATPLLAQQPDLSGHWTFNAAQSDNPRDMLQGRDSTGDQDRKSTRLNSSHSQISYAVFCLKKKKKKPESRSVHRKGKENDLGDVRNSRTSRKRT